MPELILYNGTVLTMESVLPEAQAVAVRGDRVLAVGATDAILEMAHRHTERIDLQGCCLLPGFHDSHVHVTQHGLELDVVKLHHAGTLEEGIGLVAEAAKVRPAGNWIIGAGFATSRWGVRALDKHMLDHVTPNHPVYLLSQDHHSAWVNSAALELADVHEGTPDPDGGSVARDATGAPEGLLLETARQLVARAAPSPDAEQLAHAVQRAGDDLAERGITTVHHMAFEPSDHWRELGLAASRADFPLRVWACIDSELLEEAWRLGLATGQGGTRFRIGGAKFFVDGALGSLTARMLEPYAETDERGMWMQSEEELALRVARAVEVGFAPVIHAIGDAANRLALDVLEATASRWRAKALRPRIEHVQHLAPDDVPRFSRLGVVASVQPQHLAFDAQRIRDLLGDRIDRAYPLRSLLEGGATLAFGSDTPVATPDVRLGLAAAVNRMGDDDRVLGEKEAITVLNALECYTTKAAQAISREHTSGRIRPGLDADFVILSEDPRRTVDGWQVEGTMLAGKWTKAFY